MMRKKSQIAVVSRTGSFGLVCVLKTRRRMGNVAVAVNFALIDFTERI
jgi:hypothetical protein